MKGVGEITSKTYRLTIVLNTAEWLEIREFSVFLEVR